jgi:uncharacterized membrane protein
VTEGTSALFLMTSKAAMDRVVEAMKNVKFEIIATNLFKEQEQQLRDAFGQEWSRTEEVSHDDRRAGPGLGAQ